jgi:hypothetical protein
MSSTKRANEFAKLYADECRTLSRRKDSPAYLRLWLLAIDTAGPNRHAKFKPGELVNVLGKSSRDVDNAMTKAVAYGLLHESSMQTCLVLPTFLVGIYGGNGRGVHERCVVHGDGEAAKVLATQCHHPDRRNYAYGRCESCYRGERRRAQKEQREPSWV